MEQRPSAVIRLGSGLSYPESATTACLSVVIFTHETNPVVGSSFTAKGIASQLVSYQLVVSFVSQLARPITGDHGDPSMRIGNFLSWTFQRISNDRFLDSWNSLAFAPVRWNSIPIPGVWCSIVQHGSTYDYAETEGCRIQKIHKIWSLRHFSTHLIFIELVSLVKPEAFCRYIFVGQLPVRGIHSSGSLVPPETWMPS